MTIDLIFLARNRLEFTQAAFEALLANTDWTLVRRATLYNDSSEDGTGEFLQDAAARIPDGKGTCLHGNWHGPVGVMNHALMQIDPREPMLLAKIDNDTVVPAQWLTETARVMASTLDLHFLGIEAMYQPITGGRAKREIVPATFIGGIGLMRNQAFVTLPRPSGLAGRFGFTAWQQKATWANKAWIKPSLPVFLLDRMPMEPWKSLSGRYIEFGWQRKSEPYLPEHSDLWQWWLDRNAQCA